MIKFLILGVAVAGAGAAGYFGEQFFRPTAAPEGEHAAVAKKPELLFELPLGKFTMQIMQSRKVLKQRKCCFLTQCYSRMTR